MALRACLDPPRFHLSHVKHWNGRRSVRIAQNEKMPRSKGKPFKGGWHNAGAPTEFHSTTTWSSAAGSTATFAFSGTSITVYASVADHSPGAIAISFAIDGSTQGSYTPPTSLPVGGLYHQPLWTSSPLSDEPHTLVITQTAAQTAGQIYLDYLLYSTTTDVVDAYFIDDRDSRITYSSAWSKVDGGQNDFGHTSQVAASVGASFSITFEGQSIKYHAGLVASDAGVLKASMVLDDGTPVIFTAPANTAATPNNILYDSGSISDGTHTLVVTAQTADSLWVDYFTTSPNALVASNPGGGTTSTSGDSNNGGASGGGSSVTQGSSTSASTSASASASTSAAGSASAATHSGTSSAPPGSSSSTSGGSIPLPASSGSTAPFSISSSSSNSSTSSIPGSSSKKSSPVTTIVASVLGTLLLLTLLIGAFLFLRRRKRHQTSKAPMQSVLNPRPFSEFAGSAGSTSCTALMSPDDSSRDLSAAYGSESAGNSGKLSGEMRRQREPAPGVASSAVLSPTVTASVLSDAESVPSLQAVVASVSADAPRALPSRAPSMLAGTASIISSSQYGEAPPQYST
ncbi:hypothetical protein C8R45DRAFT_946378 [Mycena sanguinolenta]|nr:hypothetical protein C8R45DRAFT_946378 [Mycena sanguinolenta]